MVDGQPDPGHGWYLSLKTWRHYAREWGAWHPTPVTMPVNILLGVLARLRRIVERGLEEHLGKYLRASRIVRAGLRNAGFEMFVPDEYAAPVVTAVKARPEFSVAELCQWLEKERGLVVAGALGELAGKIFRVGHLGKAATREYLLDFLVAVEEFLKLKGLPVPLGATLAGLSAGDGEI
jgi:alanine-glyoxylate transaminase/serine-glyoxylate transaminase/serine-pyruvate transaminase